MLGYFVIEREDGLYYKKMVKISVKFCNRRLWQLLLQKTWGDSVGNCVIEAQNVLYYKNLTNKSLKTHNVMLKTKKFYKLKDYC